MTERVKGDTRTRLISAAAALVASEPGQDISLRAVCDAVGVKMPTLYHFFGSKKGLLEAVVEHGFDTYLEAKAATESSGDPIVDIRAGWDAHAAFGLANPGFYALMYGKVTPGYSSEAAERPRRVLLSLTRQAQAHGRLVVSAEEAADHILSANVGLTLTLVERGRDDPALSAAMREGVIAAITGAGSTEGSSGLGRDLAEYAAAHPDLLGSAETQLLLAWVGRLQSGGE